MSMIKLGSLEGNFQKVLPTNSQLKQVTELRAWI